jgi:tRNA(Ile)-lysidine synthase
MGVSIDVRQYDVGLWAERRGLNLEAAARSVRYRLLASTAATMGTAQIVTGHTGGDQVETILMHLLRGAGPDGLVGLLPRQSIPLAAFGPPPPRIREGDPTLQILRPILDVERWETAEYCFVHKLSVVFDSTNEETTYLRNRIRHQLVPLLETYNPSVRDALRKLARLSQDDAEALHEVVNQEWVRYARVSTSAVRFPRVGVGMLRRAILARLIRRAAGLLIPGMGLSFDQVERCIRAMERERSVITLSRGLEWSVTPDLVILSRS